MQLRSLSLWGKRFPDGYEDKDNTLSAYRLTPLQLAMRLEGQRFENTTIIDEQIVKDLNYSQNDVIFNNVLQVKSEYFSSSACISLTVDKRLMAQYGLNEIDRVKSEPFAITSNYLLKPVQRCG